MTPDYKKELWDLIKRYAESFNGIPASQSLEKYYARQELVDKINRLIYNIELEAIRNNRSGVR